MDMARPDRSRALKRQVTTATPAGLDFRATGVADEGFADTMSTESPCSIAQCILVDQACNPGCHLQAPVIAGAVGTVRFVQVMRGYPLSGRWPYLLLIRSGIIENYLWDLQLQKIRGIQAETQAPPRTLDLRCGIPAGGKCRARLAEREPCEG